MNNVKAHRYRPYGTAIDVFSCKDKEVLYCGPAGTGKSRAILEKLHAMCLQNPGMRALMVRKTQVSLTSSGVQTYKDHVVGEAIATGVVKYFGGSGSEPAGYKYDNGSSISLAGMDKPTKILSAEYDFVYIQEATELSEKDWQFCTMRVRNGRVSFQQLMADCNPDMPTHWLNQKRLAGKVTYIKSRFEDNPVYVNQDDMTLTKKGKDYLDRLKEGLSGAMYERYINGDWVAAEGLVYSGWNQDINLHKGIDNPPMDWNLYLSVDFGFTHPFVCQFWLEDNDGRLYLWKEIYQTQTTVEDICPLILKTIGNRKVTAVICDHDAEDRATFTKHTKLQTIPAKKTVSDGLQAVMSRLNVLDDGKPRLYICRDAIVNVDTKLAHVKKPTCTQQEIVGYVWNEEKDAPVKDNDHGMDAMRYMIAYKDLNNRKVRIGWGL